MQKKRRVLLVLGLVAAFAASAGATYVEDIGGGWEVLIPDIYMNDQADQFVSVVTDGVQGDLLIIELVKIFRGDTFEFGMGQPIYVEFRVKANATSHVPYIVIRDEQITNETSRDWEDFHIMVIDNLGGAPYVGFDPQYCFETVIPGNPFAVDFAPESHYWQGVNGTPTRIDFDGAVVQAGTSFHPGLNGSSVNYVKIVTDMVPGQSFFLKEYPTVPEPLTMALLLGGALLLRKRRA